MNKKDELKDFQAEIKKLKQEKENKNQLDEEDEHDQGVINRVKTALMPVVKEFVSNDVYLQIQSDEFRAIYISYANAKVCGLLLWATSSERIDIDVVADSITSRIFSGGFNQNEIIKRVKNALLDWYRTL